MTSEREERLKTNLMIAMKALNDIDDFLEYHYVSYSKDEIKNFIINKIDNATNMLLKNNS